MKTYILKNGMHCAELKIAGKKIQAVGISRSDAKNTLLSKIPMIKKR